VSGAASYFAGLQDLPEALQEMMEQEADLAAHVADFEPGEEPDRAPEIR